MVSDPGRLLRSHVFEIPLYAPGRPIEEVERELGVVAAKLASNENPLGPAPEVVEAIAAAATKVHLYPELEAPVLRAALAQKLGVDEEAVLIAAGASHFLEVVALGFLGPGLEGLSPWPSFIHYVISSRISGGRFVQVQGADPRKVSVEEILRGVTESTRVVFVANPNNPTGAHYGRSELEALLEGLPAHTMLLWDEAYFEYVTAPDYPDGIAYLRRDPRLLVARSFSKVYALAGLRVGYGVGHPEVIRELARIRGPFKISSLAQAAALAALGATEHLRRSVHVAVEGRAYLTQALADLGLRVWPSEGNFVTVDVGTDAASVAARLEGLGYIVRPLKPFGLPTCIRVTVGTPEQNRGVVEALASLGVTSTPR